MTAIEKDLKDAAARVVARIAAPVPVVVIRSEPRLICHNCGKRNELRYGYCFACLEPYLSDALLESLRRRGGS
jgi:hypothetical protein